MDTEADNTKKITCEEPENSHKNNEKLEIIDTNEAEDTKKTTYSESEKIEGIKEKVEIMDADEAEDAKKTTCRELENINKNKENLETMDTGADDTKKIACEEPENIHKNNEKLEIMDANEAKDTKKTTYSESKKIEGIKENVETMDADEAEDAKKTTCGELENIHKNNEKLKIMDVDEAEDTKKATCAETEKMERNNEKGEIMDADEDTKKTTCAESEKIERSNEKGLKETRDVGKKEDTKKKICEEKENDEKSSENLRNKIVMIDALYDSDEKSGNMTLETKCKEKENDETNNSKFESDSDFFWKMVQKETKCKEKENNETNNSKFESDSDFFRKMVQKETKCKEKENNETNNSKFESDSDFFRKMVQKETKCKEKENNETNNSKFESDSDFFRKMVQKETKCKEKENDETNNSKFESDSDFYRKLVQKETKCKEKENDETNNSKFESDSDFYRKLVQKETKCKEKENDETNNSKFESDSDFYRKLVQKETKCKEKENDETNNSKFESDSDFYRKLVQKETKCKEKENDETNNSKFESDSDFYRKLVQKETKCKEKENDERNNSKFESDSDFFWKTVQKLYGKIENSENYNAKFESDSNFFWRTTRMRDQNVRDRSLDLRYFKRTEDDDSSNEADLNNLNNLTDDLINAPFSSAHHRDVLQVSSKGNSSNPISKPERDQNVPNRSLDFRFFKRTEDGDSSNEADLNNLNNLTDDRISAPFSSADNRDVLQESNKDNSSNPISKPESVNPNRFNLRNKFTKQENKYTENVDEECLEDENDFGFLIENALLLDENMLTEYKRMKLPCEFICIGGQKFTHSSDMLNLNVWFTNITISCAFPFIPEYTMVKSAYLYKKNVKYENITFKDDDITKIWYHKGLFKFCMVIFLSASVKNEIKNKLNLLKELYDPDKENFQNQIILVSDAINGNQDLYLRKNFSGREKMVIMDEETVLKVKKFIDKNHTIPITERLSTFPVNFDLMYTDFEEKEDSLENQRCPPFLDVHENCRKSSSSSECSCKAKDTASYLHMRDGEPIFDETGMPTVPSKDVPKGQTLSCLKRNIVKLTLWISELHNYFDLSLSFFNSKHLEFKNVYFSCVFEKCIQQKAESVLNWVNIGALLEIQEERLGKLQDNEIKSQNSCGKKDPGYENILHDTKLDFIGESDHKFFMNKIKYLIVSWNSLLKKVMECKKFRSSGSFYAHLQVQAKILIKNMDEAEKKIMLSYSSFGINSESAAIVHANLSYLHIVLEKCLEQMKELDEFFNTIPQDNLFMDNIKQEYETIRKRYQEMKKLDCKLMTIHNNIVESLKSPKIVIKAVDLFKKKNSIENQSDMKFESNEERPVENQINTEEKSDMEIDLDEEKSVRNQPNTECQESSEENESDVEMDLDEERLIENQTKSEEERNSEENKTDKKLNINDEKSGEDQINTEKEKNVVENETVVEINVNEQKSVENQTNTKEEMISVENQTVMEISVDEQKSVENQTVMEINVGEQKSVENQTITKLEEISVENQTVMEISVDEQKSVENQANTKVEEISIENQIVMEISVNEQKSVENQTITKVEEISIENHTVTEINVDEQKSVENQTNTKEEEISVENQAVMEISVDEQKSVEKQTNTKVEEISIENQTVMGINVGEQKSVENQTNIKVEEISIENQIVMEISVVEQKSVENQTITKVEEISIENQTVTEINVDEQKSVENQTNVKVEEILIENETVMDSNVDEQKSVESQSNTKEEEISVENQTVTEINVDEQKSVESHSNTKEEEISVENQTVMEINVDKQKSVENQTNVKVEEILVENETVMESNVDEQKSVESQSNTKEEEISVENQTITEINVDEQKSVESQSNTKEEEISVENQTVMEINVDEQKSVESQSNTKEEEISVENETVTEINVDEQKSVESQSDTKEEEISVENQTDKEIVVVKELTCETLLCQCIKFGSFEVNPTPPKKNIPILFSKDCISFPTTSMELCKTSSKIVIKKEDISDMRSHVTRQPYVIFMAASMNFNDISIEEFSFKDDTQESKRIIFIVESAPSENQRNFLQVFNPKIAEMNHDTAVELISQFSTQVTPCPEVQETLTKILQIVDERITNSQKTMLESNNKDVVSNLKDLRILLKPDILDSSNFKDGVTTVRIFLKLPRYEGISISYSDLSCLDKPKYLTDNVIDLYLNYILSELPSKLSERIHLFSSTFYLKCTRTNFHECSGRKGIAKWSRDTDIFSKDFILIPVCKAHHWILIIVCYCGSAHSKNKSLGERRSKRHKRPCILVFDSLKGTDYNHEIISLIRKYLQSEWFEKKAKKISLKFHQITEFSEESLPVERVRCPSQKNDLDCGLFVLQFMKSFFSNKSIYESSSPEITFNRYISRKEVKEDIIKLLIKSCCK